MFISTLPILTTKYCFLSKCPHYRIPKAFFPSAFDYVYFNFYRTSQVLILSCFKIILNNSHKFTYCSLGLKKTFSSVCLKCAWRSFYLFIHCLFIHYIQVLLNNIESMINCYKNEENGLTMCTYIRYSINVW